MFGRKAFLRVAELICYCPDGVLLLRRRAMLLRRRLYDRIASQSSSRNEGYSKHVLKIVIAECISPLDSCFRRNDSTMYRNDSTMYQNDSTMYRNVHTT